MSLTGSVLLGGLIGFVGGYVCGLVIALVVDWRREGKR